jgi:hypothetical protein
MRLRLAFVFLSIICLHACGTFWCWALAEAHPVHSNFIGSIGWSILSFPLFFLVSSTFANANFWLTTFLNSAIWALALTGVAKRFFASGSSKL